MDTLFAFFSINELFGQAELASEHGGQIDHMLEVVHWFMFILFIGWTAFFLFVICRFHRRFSPKASYTGVTSHFPKHLEVMVVVVEVVLLLGFAFPLWAQRVDTIPGNDEEGVVRIRAVAEQFRWTFHYTGADNRFGLVRPDHIDATNPIGLVKQDPNSNDDFISSELMLPIDRKIVIQVTSKDVIHNLALVPMRTQQDAIPGVEIPLWFVPTKTGRWDIICGQLCGSGHAKMVAKMEVVDQGKFDDWYKQRTDMAVQASAPKE